MSHHDQLNGGLHSHLDDLGLERLAHALTSGSLISRLERWASDGPAHDSFLSQMAVTSIRWQKSIGVPTAADYRDGFALTHRSRGFNAVDRGNGQLEQEPWRDAPLAPTVLPAVDDDTSYFVPVLVFPVSVAVNVVLVTLTTVDWTAPGLGLLPKGVRRDVQPSGPHAFAYVKGYGDQNGQPVTLPHYEVILGASVP